MVEKGAHIISDVRGTAITLEEFERQYGDPDVVAILGPITEPYPTKAVDVAIEILSPEDSFLRVMSKCKYYAEWGIPVIVVIDPESREGWIWKGALQPASIIELTNGKQITFERIWEELDARLVP